MSTQATPANRARDAAGIPRKELSVIEAKTEQRISVVRSMLPAFSDAIRNEATAKRLVRDAITAIRTTPKLIDTTQESFLGALMTAAQLDLRPNVSSLGHGWVLPYENRRKNVVEANWILGYRGMVTLGGRSGVSIVARTIYSNEPHVIEFGLNERLDHSPIFNREKRGDPINHYAIARSASGMAWVVISDADAREARDGSPGYKFGGPDNPWRAHYGAMARKTAVRRLFAFIPTDSPELAMGIASDGTVRTDLDPDVLEQMDGTPEPTTYAQSEGRETITVERGEAAKEPPPKGEGKRAATQRGKAESQPAAATASARRAPNRTALWKGLRRQAEDVHGPALLDVAHRVTGSEVDPDMLVADELRAVIAFNVDEDADAQARAEYEAEMSARGESNDSD